MPYRFMPSAAVLALLLATPLSAVTPALVHVPKDVSDLQRAMGTVANNGVIELAPGTYPAPASGWSLSNNRKAFTVRAAANGPVILDGQGSRRIFRFKNNLRAGTRPVTFERLTFRGGASTTEGDAGGVTLKEAEARFEGCAFLANKATPASTGGGAVRLFSHSTAAFVDTRFEGNGAKSRGGALAVEEGSSATVTRGTFLGNRTNLPGASRNSSGGAIYALNSTVLIQNSLFDGNQAGWVGGAVYGIGVWAAPEAAPRTSITVLRSTFRNNAATFDPCCVPPGQTTGGAIHAEDQTTLTVERSFFTNNLAEAGGAIDGYRALVDVKTSVFTANGTPIPGRLPGVGGAIFVGSIDFADSSTQAGAINRRPARLTVADSAFVGRPNPVSSAHAAGCLFAGGDTDRAYGEGGVALSGSIADNRAQVTVRHSLFYDCDVERTAAGTGGSGGAIGLALADLTLEDSLITGSDARGLDSRGGGAFGGGLSVEIDSLARVSRTTFGNDSAAFSGGAIQVVGSEIEIADSRFQGNALATSGNLPTSRGAGLFVIPRLAQHPHNATGTVARSIFTDNLALPIYDVDPPGAGDPINDVRYEDNQFYSWPFGSLVYLNTLAAPQGLSPDGLNSLIGYRGNRPSTLKGRGNVPLFGPPSLGTLVAVASAGSTAAPSGGLVGFAWSGFTSTLNGQPLPPQSKSGVLPNLPPATYSLTVDGRPAATAVLAP
jgi:hypothetical protein